MFLMDGAFGTRIQDADITAADWGGRSGCNEYLNLSRPDIVRRVHADYLRAGADAVETNTFGAAPSTLAEYNLEDRAEEINRAAARCARAAAEAESSAERRRYVFGSIGPGTKLVSLGHTSFDVLRNDYRLQIDALLSEGADGILLETCQDMLQVKAGVMAFEDVAAGDRNVPLYASVTIEESGTMLMGSSIDAVSAILSALPVTVLGINCATGPRAMRRHLQYLGGHWSGLIGVMPNAGMPEMRHGAVSYPLAPEDFSATMAEMVRELGINIVGGCCGTTPDHIRRLAQKLDGYVPREREVESCDQCASLFSALDLDQRPAPLYIGERANATGSRAFRRKLEADDYDGALEILTGQEDRGAHMVDLNVAYPDGDEVADMRRLAARAARECRLPLMIDSTNPQAIEAALKHYGGRPFVNSINFEDGEQRPLAIARLARSYGAGLVALTIDEEGMARTAERKLEVARRIVEFCERRCGIGRGSILIDPLTFTVASGDETLRDAARETLKSISMIKSELPGVRIVLGASNISYGLKAETRKVVNALFLDLAIRAGLDAAIVSVAALLPLNSIEPVPLALARGLLENDRKQGDPLLTLIETFDAQDSGVEDTEQAEQLSDAKLLERKIVRGLKVDADLLERLIEARSAEDILNGILVPAMAEVGRLFNQGALQLPFVLRSAEVMKKAVDMVKPQLHREDSSRRRGCMLLATVAGDVHDIGKNLVDIILSNNGFNVINLGTKVSAEKILAGIKEHRPDVLGLSGLLVKSTGIMADNLRYLKDSGVNIPVFLGGAALTSDFVARHCQSSYDGPVVYCRDAFAGLEHLRAYMDAGRLPRADISPALPVEKDTAKADEKKPACDVALPEPPFWGNSFERAVDLDRVFAFLNKRALFRGRWGYRQHRLSDSDYSALLREKVEPKYDRFVAECKERGLFRPQAAWGYFGCRSEGEDLIVDAFGQEERMHFPRSDRSPHRSLADYFRSDRDVAAFMVVTMGERYAKECARLHGEDAYEEYFLFHGLMAELTDALAMLWHSRIRAELGFPDPEGITPEDHFKGRYRGRRFGFGYSACPDVLMNAVCCRLVQADRIGVTVTESGMMIPGVSTAAIVVHNDRAEY